MTDNIDVIIPTYMETVRLAEAVDSCKIQTYSPNKIIIVDDGSDEATQSWLKLNYSSDPQIILILSSHTSLPGIARSIGIEASNAKWLAFLDADDSWDAKKLETQLIYANNNNVEFVSTNAIVKIRNQPDEVLLSNIPRKIDFQDLVKTNWIVNSSVIVKSELFKGRFKYATDSRVRAVEDYATWLRLATEIDLHIIPQPLTNYRVSSSSIRSDDVVDPRIFAFADFLIWAKVDEQFNSRNHKKHKSYVLNQIAKHYGN
jgi:teichuronic acid biosynthesis glycosyltransferase TuaG